MNVALNHMENKVASNDKLMRGGGRMGTNWHLLVTVFETAYSTACKPG